MKLLLLTLATLAAMTPVFGITCYKCDSDEPDYQGYCRDPYSGQGDTCEGEVCAKAKAELTSLGRASNSANII